MYRKIFLVLSLLLGVSLIANPSSQAQSCGNGNFMIDEDGNCIDLSHLGRYPTSSQSQEKSPSEDEILALSESGLSQRFPSPSSLYLHSFNPNERTIVNNFTWSVRSESYIDLESITRIGEIVTWNGYGRVYGNPGFSGYPSSAWGVRRNANCQTFTTEALVRVDYYGTSNPNNLGEIKEVKIYNPGSERIQLRNYSPFKKTVDFICSIS
jgi:hypothetical protein